MANKFRHSAGFGRRMEYWLISQMLREDALTKKKIEYPKPRYDKYRANGSANESAQQKQQTEQSQTAATKITTTSLPEGAANKPYPQTAMQAAGLTPPLNWTVAPPLPAGLTLDAATGTIGGTPTAPAPKTSHKFTVTDSAVPAVSSTAALNLEIK